MGVKLVSNSYGKSDVRLVRITRGEQHELKDITVSVQFEGDFDAVHTEGDNRRVLPTDTMKNTVYVLAGQQPVGEIEHFAGRLISHFLSNNPQVSIVKVNISEHLWSRIPVGGNDHPTAFMASSRQERTAKAVGSREGMAISAGIKGLLVLKTAGSAFDRYIKDRYTTLAETRDRIFATELEAEWDYGSSDSAFVECWQTIRQALLESFATHESESVQHTLYAMGKAALQGCHQASEIRLAMPNKHHLVFDLSRFGLENRNEVFVPTDEPYGLIRATIRRTKS